MKLIDDGAATYTAALPLTGLTRCGDYTAAISAIFETGTVTLSLSATQR